MPLLTKTMTAAAFALALAVPAQAHAAGSQAAWDAPAASPLAADTLADGRQADAIRLLERARAAAPDDAAILINLGIAYAQAGNEERAADLFQAALVSDDVILLQTASGEETDSRRLARKALRMLRDGEFRPAGAKATDTLSLRD